MCNHGLGGGLVERIDDGRGRGRGGRRGRGGAAGLSRSAWLGGEDEEVEAEPWGTSARRRSAGGRGGVR